MAFLPLASAAVRRRRTLSRLSLSAAAAVAASPLPLSWSQLVTEGHTSGHIWSQLATGWITLVTFGRSNLPCPRRPPFRARHVEVVRHRSPFDLSVAPLLQIKLNRTTIQLQYRDRLKGGP